MKSIKEKIKKVRLLDAVLVAVLVFTIFVSFYQIDISVNAFNADVKFTPHSVFSSTVRYDMKTDMQPAAHINRSDIHPLNTAIVISGDDLETIHSEGDSMKPTFRNDSVEILKTKFAPDEVHVGDIVLYRTANPHNFTNHRVIWRNATHFQAQGDNNPIPDPIIQPIANITGIVVGILY